MNCSHPNPTTVDATHGETLAYLCPDCDTQLPASFSDEIARRRELQARQETCVHNATKYFTDGLGQIIVHRCSDCLKALPVAA